MHRAALPIANKSVTVTSLTDTAQTLIAASAGATGQIVIQAIIAHHGAANHHVNLRSIDDATHYLGFTLAANETWKWETPLAFPASKGIEAITEGAAGDIELTIFYWEPGSAGIGG